jgi:Tol biopolymer transport system component
LGTDKKNASEVEEMNHYIETCNNGKELIKKPVNIVVTNLGEGVNTKYPEYSPVVSLDEETLIFTSRRNRGTSDYLLPDGQYLEDIYISNYVNGKWGKATLISPNINSMDCEASINLSSDGSNLLVYKDDNGDGNIYESELKGNNWGTLKYEMSPINSAAWETHACYSSDNRVLYFVSNRTGGFGGRDIYKCLRLPNGKWGPA